MSLLTISITLGAALWVLVVGLVLGMCAAARTGDAQRIEPLAPARRLASRPEAPVPEHPAVGARTARSRPGAGGGAPSGAGGGRRRPSIRPRRAWFSYSSRQC